LKSSHHGDLSAQGRKTSHVNAFKVQAFLGHADLSTTRRHVRDSSPQDVTTT
jgi:hypothetical protein